MVLEPLFTSILAGKAPSGEDILNTLQSLDSPFSPHEKFLAISLDITERNGSKLQALETSLVLLQIRELLRHKLPKSYHNF